MKLYTEEQVLDAYNAGNMDGRLNNTDYSIIDGFIPIELPSDEEIARVGLDFSVGYDVLYWNGFKHCGEWMKQQILNQNK